MTLTTDVLRQIVETDHVQCGDAAAMARELLANREAQPVAYIADCGSVFGPNDFAGGAEEMHFTAAHEKMVALYTATPAPANAVAWEMRFWNSGHGCWHEWERITAEQHAEMSVQHATDNDYEFRALYDAPPAPAVNASPDFEAWFVEKYKQPERLVKNEDGTYKFSGIQMAFSAWNACRASNAGSTCK
ncbi:TPA: hypothetical protein ACXM6M_000646 [Serratia marcescens]